MSLNADLGEGTYPKFNISWIDSMSGFLETSGCESRALISEEKTIPPLGRCAKESGFSPNLSLAIKSISSIESQIANANIPSR
jgi:hypothetical protein